jgi:hypothetical protein
MSMADMETATAPTASGEDRGALFAYVVPEPVSAGRGRSVLVPLVSQRVEGRRELLYKSGSAMNGNPPSPIASLRLTSSTGLTLERGPVTVLEHGGYGGEAIVTFSPPGASFVVPYAVELGVRIAEEREHRTVVQSLDQALHDGLGEIMALYSRLDDIDHQRSVNADAKSELHERQGQARANLGALGTSGNEGSLRHRYVAIISESEDRLATLQNNDDSLAAEHATIESEINTKLDALNSPRTAG